MEFKKPNKRQVLSIIACISIVPIFCLVLYWFGIVFTYTGSVPVGFYRIEPTQKLMRGDYASFCLPDNLAKQGMERGYIGRGGCQNGSEALIKEIIAVPGDKIIVTNDKLVVNGPKIDQCYSAPTRLIDNNDLPVIRQIKNGIYISNGYWVYGIGSPRYSWDSRYYGGISKDNITHKLIPILIF